MPLHVLASSKTGEALQAQWDRMQKRIAELEGTLRKWRDHYERCDGFTSVKVPVHQITALVGER